MNPHPDHSALKRVLAKLPQRGLYLVAPEDDGKGFTIVYANNPTLTMKINRDEGETLEQAVACVRSHMPNAEILLPS